MDQESLQHTYELITNPILRLLVYFLAAAVVGLATACIYLYKDHRSVSKELIVVNQEVSTAHTQLASALLVMKERLDDLDDRITEHLIGKNSKP